MSKEHKEEIPVYKNTAEDLKDYITEHEFYAFSNQMMYTKPNSHKKYSDLSEAQKSNIKFYVKSAEPTPSINGYISAIIPGSENVDEIGLVGYIPADIE